MRKARTFSAFFTATLLALAGAAVLAQTPLKSSGNIVCWKDKSGKTVGCGDKVPPEYQDNATREINKRGITVKQTEPAQTAEQKQALAAEAEQKKIEAQKREEERRRDRALLDSFTNEKEIELKRNRDIQQIEINISAQQTNLKNVTDRQNETRGKIDQFKKQNNPVPAPLQEDFNRWENERLKIQGQILQKRKDIVERNGEYDAMKKRFLELKGAAGTPAATPAVAGAKPAAGK